MRLESKNAQEGPAPAKPVSVALVDDHEAFREAACRFLARRFEVVADVGTGAELIAAVQESEPAVVVVDISLPDMSGIDVVKFLRSSDCRSAIVMLTLHDDVDLADMAFDAGAGAFVVKDRMTLDLEHAISEALAGHWFISTI